MLHPVFVGFFDHDGLMRNEIIVSKKIDMTFVRKRLKEVGELSADEQIGEIGNDVFVMKDGYFESPDMIHSQEAAEFVANIARATGCEIARYNVDQPYTPEKFLKGFYDFQEYKRNRIASRKSNDR